MKAKNTNIKFIDKLDVIAIRLKEYSQSFPLLALIYFSKFIFGISNILGLKLFSGVEIGFEHKELGFYLFIIILFNFYFTLLFLLFYINKGIRVGGILSVIGKVVYDFEDNSLKIIDPYVYLNNPNIYKQFLKSCISQY